MIKKLIFNLYLAMQCVPGAQDRMVLRLWCVKKVTVYSPVDLCFPVCPGWLMGGFQFRFRG
ncbi:MAG: hypothetical protein ACLVLD_12225 [Hungatella sp.]